MQMLKLQTTGAQRDAARGKDLRASVPRTSHGPWAPPPDRRDPIALIKETAAGRLEYLLPLRYERMCENAFTFFRGSAAIMASDLAATPATGSMVQAVGDAHCLNFGGFATPERHVIFDLNDFDETLRGPWEWDIKRLATSLVLAGRNVGLRTHAIDAATLATIGAYRVRMADLAAMPALDVWYSRIDATNILDEATEPDVRRRRSRIVEQAATEPIRSVVEKLSQKVDGLWRFREDPPTLFHSSETDRVGFDIEAMLAAYRASLHDDLAHLFSRYHLVDHAIKVVGVGSVGTRCGIALLAADDHDPLLLQIKEARDSVLVRYLEPSPYRNNGERVIRGQRLLQHASDVFLAGRRRASARLEGVDGPELRTYGEVCAYALAAAHAGSGNAAAIAGYLGRSDTFDRALSTFATTYADQAESDFRYASGREHQR